ncbi:hypothetical protein [Lentzea aerocolonigenes]|uniref:hypothetical protein n=1 Tax=Lentzea aerocolonigenes TaxID=68170 RepID=UPI0004C3CD15|nr:hypothetical protein [Lentzea aerocolonigenes]MCP2248738.1 hypothetical protein [Lentzea aerocolonigenes]
MSLDFTPALKRIESMILATGLFKQVNLHEPKNAPGKGLVCAVYLDDIGPVPQESGQNVTTGRVVFKARIFLPMLTKPEGLIDQTIGHAACKIIEVLSGDIDLQNNVKYVDLLGATGTTLSAKGGYLTIDTTMFRIMDVTIPLIFNDIWNQGT